MRDEPGAGRADEPVHPPRAGKRWGRPLVVAAVVVALAFAGGVAYRLRPGPALTVLPPPSGPWPVEGFTVTLCAGTPPRPEGCAQAATEQGRRAVEAAIRAVPGVAKVSFVPAKEFAGELNQMTGEEEPGGSGFTEDGTVPRFVGELRVRGDAAATRPAEDELRAAVEKLPAVADVLFEPGLFWAGKADLAVRLCAASADQEPPCAGRGRPTPDERRAIENALSSIEGIGTVFFEPAQHARKVAESALGVLPRLEEIGEAYHIKLTDPQAADTIKSTLEPLPGVAGMVPHLAP
ncbi:permease-like cell division protein FtsX [Sphaerisporangium album]|uniref:permease-like cell division protein FtsX n=1 Tax=Sphaerisporangium album TaxID=509200 RepID=UPI0011C01E33|nr:permease-like cell division protein FtsX [Sphaerisporangium album]